MLGFNQVPVFVINGFLESGKTTFIYNAFLKDENLKRERVALVCCEEGEEEYNDVPSNVRLYTVEDDVDFTEELLSNINKEYKPTVVFIEYNGIWGMQRIYKTKLPSSWKVIEQVTVIDSTTFASYFDNMKSIFADMLRSSTTVFVNRCTREDDFKFYKSSIKNCAPHAEIIYLSDTEGPLQITLEEELPYNVDADVIEISRDNYMTWYIDMLDTPARYIGKKVEYIGQAVKPDYFGKDSFTVGNMVMTCCEDDMQFLGFLCRYDKATFVKEGALVKVRGQVRHEYAAEYESEGPVIYVEKTTTMPNPDEKKRR